MLSCVTCRYSLIGEQQKGHVYYRCHSKQCRATSIREETVGIEIDRFLRELRFCDEEKEYFKARILTLRQTWASEREDAIRSVKLRLDQTKDRLNRLTDAYLDQALDKVMFEERKKSLLFEQKTFEEKLTNINRDKSGGPGKLVKFLELLESASLSHEIASLDEKREIVNILTSNRQVDGKNLYLKPSIPFQEIANRFKSANGDPERMIPRTWDRLLATLSKLNAAGELPDLSKVFDRGKNQDTSN